MKIKVDSTASFNMGSVYKSSAQRSHDLAHSRRYTGGRERTGANEVNGKDDSVKRYYKHNNVDTNLSQYNYYADKMYKGLTPYQILKSRFNNKCNIHDKKQINQHHYKRLYGSYTLVHDIYNSRNGVGNITVKSIKKSATDGYLQHNYRWLKPVRSLPLRFCDEKEKQQIIKMCKDKGISTGELAKAINMGYCLYAKHFNSSHQYMKITNLHTNLFDESGGFHAHTDYLALGTTAKGQPSTSFNRAIKQDSDTKLSRKSIASYFVNSQFKDLQNSMSKSFKNVLGVDVEFVQVHHRHKGKFIKDLTSWQHMKDLNHEKSQLLGSANKQNAKLQAEVKRLIDLDGVQKIALHGRESVSDSLLKEVDKSAELLIKQNKQLKLKLQSNQRTVKQNQKLKSFIKNELDGLVNYNNKIAKTNKGYVRSLASLRKQLNIADKKLNQYQQICSPDVLKVLEMLLDEPKTISRKFYRVIAKKYVKGLKNANP